MREKQSHSLKAGRGWGWLLVLILIPPLLFITPASSWLLVLVPVILLLQAWADPDHTILPLSAFNPALLLLAVMLLVSLWSTPDLALSLSKIAGLLLGLLLFFTILRYTPTRASWSVALLAFLAAGLAATLLGLAGTQWFTAKLTLLNELTGRLPRFVRGLPGAEVGIHPNILAGTLLWVLPVAAFGALALARRPDWRARLGAPLLTGIALLTAGVLVLAQSRGAYLAAVLTALMLALAMLPPRARRQALAFGSMALVIGLWWGSQTGWQSLLTDMTTTFPVGESALSTGTFTERLEIWSQAQSAIRDAPVTGLGMDIFRMALPMLYPFLAGNRTLPVTHAHNELLQAALDLGLPGLVAFLALNLIAGVMLVRLGRQTGAVRLLALGMGGGLLAHFLFGLTDATALGGRPGIFFWMLLGLVASLYRLSDWPSQPQDQEPIK